MTICCIKNGFIMVYGIHFQTSSMGSLSLLEFACSKVNISYAVVTVEVRSEYSLPYTICVHLPQGIVIYPITKSVLIIHNHYTYMLYINRGTHDMYAIHYEKLLKTIFIRSSRFSKH